MSWSRAKSYEYKSNWDTYEYVNNSRKRTKIKTKYEIVLKREIEKYIKENFPQFKVYRYCGELSLITNNPTLKINYSDYDNRFQLLYGDEGKVYSFEIEIINEKIKEIIKEVYSEEDYNFMFK